MLASCQVCLAWSCQCFPAPRAACHCPPQEQSRSWGRGGAWAGWIRRVIGGRTQRRTRRKLLCLWKWRCRGPNQAHRAQSLSLLQTFERQWVMWALRWLQRRPTNAIFFGQEIHDRCVSSGAAALRVPIRERWENRLVRVICGAMGIDPAVAEDTAALLLWVLSRRMRQMRSGVQLLGTSLYRKRQTAVNLRIHSMHMHPKL